MHIAEHIKIDINGGVYTVLSLLIHFYPRKMFVIFKIDINGGVKVS